MKSFRYAMVAVFLMAAVPSFPLTVAIVAALPGGGANGIVTAIASEPSLSMAFGSRQFDVTGHPEITVGSVWTTLTTRNGRSGRSTYTLSWNFRGSSTWRPPLSERTTASKFPS